MEENDRAVFLSVNSELLWNASSLAKMSPEDVDFCSSKSQPSVC